jgi:hypothetical protein
MNYIEFKKYADVQHDNMYEQGAIIERIKNLVDVRGAAIMFNEAGMCFGFSQMTVNAHLAGDYETYTNRLRLIANIPKDQFASCLAEMEELGRTLRMQAAQAMNDAASAQGTAEEITALLTALRLQDQANEVTNAVNGIDAYLTGISIYMHPGKYIDASKPDLHILDINDHTSSENQIGLAPVVRQLLQPVDSDSLLNQVTEATTTIGCYNQDELETYLTQLNSLPNDLPFALRMGNGEHSISLQRDDQGWILIDPNKLPELRFSSEQLPEIANALEDSLDLEDVPKHTLIRAELYVNAKNLSRAQSTINLIQASQVWQKMHNLTEEKAGFLAFLKLANMSPADSKIFAELIKITKLDLSSILWDLSDDSKKIDLALSILNIPRTNPNYIAHGFSALATPLEMACYVGNLKLVKALLDDSRFKLYAHFDPLFNHKNWQTLEGETFKQEIQKKIEMLKQYNTTQNKFTDQNEQNSSSSVDITSKVQNIERETALAMVKVKGQNLINYHDFVNDEEIVTAAYKQDINSLIFAGSDLLNNKDFIIKAVSHNSWALLALHYTESDLKNDPDIAAEAIKYNSNLYMYVSEFLSETSTMLAIKKDGKLLEYAPTNLKDKEVIVLAAVMSNSRALKHASERLKNDKKFLLELISQKPDVITFIPEQQINDSTFLLEAIKKNSKVIRYMSTSMENYTQFMLDYFEKNPDKLELIPNNLRNNGMFMYDLIRSNKKALEYVSAELKKEKIFGLTVNHLLNMESKVQMEAKEEQESDKQLFENAKQTFEKTVDKQNQALLKAKSDLETAVTIWINEKVATINASTMRSKAEIETALSSLSQADAVIQSFNESIKAAIDANTKAKEVGFTDDALINIDGNKQRITQAINAKTAELKERLEQLQKQAQQDLSNISLKFNKILLDFDQKLANINPSLYAQDIQSAIKLLDDMQQERIEIENLTASVTKVNNKAEDAGIEYIKINIDDFKKSIEDKKTKKSAQLTQQLIQIKADAHQTLKNLYPRVINKLSEISSALRMIKTDSVEGFEQALKTLSKLSTMTKELSSEASKAIDNAKLQGVNTESHQITQSLIELTSQNNTLDSKVAELSAQLEQKNKANQNVTTAITIITDSYKTVTEKCLNISQHTPEVMTQTFTSFTQLCYNFQLRFNNPEENPSAPDQLLVEHLLGVIKDFSKKKEELKTTIASNQIDAQTNLQQINQKTSELLSYLSKTPTPTTIAVVARLQQEVQQLDTLQQDTKRILGKLPKNSLPNALKILQEAEVAINLATKELNTSASAKKTVAPDGSQEISPQQKKQRIVFSMFKDLHSQSVSDSSPLTAINISQELNISTDQLKQGIELTVPTTQHKFTFKHDEGNIAQAILTRQQAGLKDNEPIAVKDDKLRKDICIDVINMIENVLSQGENLNLKISDPYLAAFGRYYVEYLKLLKEPKLNISSNEENLSAGTAQQREEFKQIVTMYHQHHSLANMKWVHEHITKTTSPLLSLSTGPCIS